MAPLDFVVIIAYLGIVIAVNQYWASRVAFADWLTSKNTIGWRFLTFTVVSTNVGAGTILGTAGSTSLAQPGRFAFGRSDAGMAMTIVPDPDTHGLEEFI